jgi:ribosomal protein L11 methyltransferase
MWYALDVDIDPVAREAVEYGLMEAGALGTETNDTADNRLLISAYFDKLPERESIRTALAETLRLHELPSSSIRTMDMREVADEDWLGEWKKNWQPVRTGHFLVAPPWSEIPESTDQIIIRIEPGMAFGTGTHETTRLCLSAVEKYYRGGSFLDVGTGTGILAIAAAKLAELKRAQLLPGSAPLPEARIEACDTDADAIEIARENARLNGVADLVAFRVGTIEEATASADVVCANLTADVITPMLPALVGLTCGRLILSGILDSQAEGVTARLRELGLSSPSAIEQDGEWVAIIV